MKISNNNRHISFEKKLVAMTSVIKDDEPKTCNIYQLDKSEDRNYFANLLKNKDWTNNSFLQKMNCLMKRTSVTEQFYVIEDVNEECLGYMLVDEKNQNSYKKVNFIETCPKYRNDKSQSPMKYVGETLLAFLASLSKRFNTSLLVISQPMDSARAFYEKKCGFMLYDADDYKLEILPSSKYDDLLSQNQNHTKSKIVLLV